MEKLLSNELAKYLIIIGAGAFAISAITAKLIAKVRGSFKPYQKSTILYLLVFLLFFCVIALAALPGFFNKSLTVFLCLQAYFLLLGSFHVFFMKTNIGWAKEGSVFIPELLFTIMISLFGCMAFLAIYQWINKNGMQYILASSILFFIIPFFFYYAFHGAMSIPPKVLKQWYYPVGEEIEEPEDSKMKNLLVISFEFQKHSDDAQITNFRAKAPRDMEFGQLFYYFINDYNEMHKTSKIQYTNGSGKPQGWIFYKKPKWHSVATQYVDADKTIFTNRIHENDVIICSRIHV
jgi:hypothetical protein